MTRHPLRRERTRARAALGAAVGCLLFGLAFWTWIFWAAGLLPSPWGTP